MNAEEKREHIRQSHRNWVAKNKEHRAAYMAAFIATGKAAAASKAWKDANKKRIAEYNKQWRVENKDVAAACTKAWRSKNRDKVRIYEHNRRAISGSKKLRVDAIRKLLPLQKNKCACCKVSLDGGYELDHIMPLKRGGEHSFENLQLLCAPCNRRKQAIDPITFMQSRGFLL